MLVSLNFKTNYKVAVSGFQSDFKLCLIISAGDTGLCVMLLMYLQKILLMCFGADYFLIQWCARM